jgi:hypothetical protein
MVSAVFLHALTALLGYSFLIQPAFLPPIVRNPRRGHSDLGDTGRKPMTQASELEPQLTKKMRKAYKWELYYEVRRKRSRFRGRRRRKSDQ